MRSVPEGFSRHGKPSNLSLPAAPGSREPSIHAALIVAQGVGHPRLAVAAASKRENWRAFCISRLSRARHRRAAIAVFARKPARPCFAFWQPTRRAPRCNEHWSFSNGINIELWRSGYPRQGQADAGRWFGSHHGSCKRRCTACPGRGRQRPTRYQQIGKGWAADDTYDGRRRRLRARSFVEILSRNKELQSRLLRMPDRGIEKMEERAEAARSRWRVIAAVSTALLVAKSLAGKAMALIWRRPPNARPP